ATTLSTWPDPAVVTSATSATGATLATGTTLATATGRGPSGQAGRRSDVAAEGGHAGAGGAVRVRASGCAWTTSRRAPPPDAAPDAPARSLSVATSSAAGCAGCPS